jgi:putative oxidoreductase
MTTPHNTAYAIARALMATIFLVAGVRKLMGYAGTLGYLGSLGVPLPDVVLPLTILVELGGGIALLIGWRAGWAAVALGLFTLASALLAHRFWAAEPAQFSNQLNHFLKNVAIAGGFLLVAAVELQRRPENQPVRAGGRQP